MAHDMSSVFNSAAGAATAAASAGMVSIFLLDSLQTFCINGSLVQSKWIFLAGLCGSLAWISTFRHIALQ